MQQTLPTQHSDGPAALTEPTSARAAMIINRYLIDILPLNFLSLTREHTGEPTL